MASNERPRTTLVIDGQLCSDGVNTVEACCYEEIAKGKPVQILLRDLTSIDEAGKALLRRMAEKGIELLASGVYTSYVVEMIVAAKAANFRKRVRDHKKF